MPAGLAGGGARNKDSIPWVAISESSVSSRPREPAPLTCIPNFGRAHGRYAGGGHHPHDRPGRGPGRLDDLQQPGAPQRGQPRHVGRRCRASSPSSKPTQRSASSRSRARAGAPSSPAPTSRSSRQQRSNEEQVRDYERISGEASKALKSVSKPTVAVIRGWCIGGGLGIAAYCDLRFADRGLQVRRPRGKARPRLRASRREDADGHRRARLHQGDLLHRPALHRRRGAGDGLRQPRPARGRRSTPSSPAQLATIAANAPLTLRALKATVRELLRGGDADLALSKRLVAECFASDDYKEGRRAFMEKRQPVFQGR